MGIYSKTTKKQNLTLSSEGGEEVEGKPEEGEQKDEMDDLGWIEWEGEIIRVCVCGGGSGGCSRMDECAFL